MKKALFSSYLIIFLIAISSGVRAQYITTVAGTGTPAFGGDGASAIAAQLHGNFGIAFDGSGNLYIADTGNHRIRKVTLATGVISTVAGTGVSGFSGDGGAATAAKLNNPSGVVIDASDNIYIADQLNHRIRMVDASTGIINTVAGTGSAGFSGDGGAAVAAQLSRPYSVALDAAGDLYVADRSNSRVRKVTLSTGVISTVAGSGTVGFSGDGGQATAANLNRPLFIAFDGSGNMFIVDNGNNRIRSVDGSGVINTEAGNGSTTYATGAATASGLNGPTSIVFDASNNYYIADAGNHGIRLVTNATSGISTVAGTGTAGFNSDCITPTTAELNVPGGVAMDLAGNLTISDGGNNRVRKIIPPCSGTPAAGGAVASATTGCPFYASTLSLSGAAIGCDLAYQWQSSADGTTFSNVTGATNNTYAPSLAASTYFQCIVTCTTSGSAAVSGSVFLNVNPLPVISAISGPSLVCIGSTITLTDTATSGSWSATNGSGTITSTGDFTGVFAGTDTIRYSSTNGCGTTTATQVVGVFPVVTPGLSISANPGLSVCNGYSVTYTATGINGGTSPLYQWYVNGTYAGLGAFFTYTPSNGDVISCTLTTSAPCATAATATASVTMLVTSLLTPGVVVANGTLGDTVCAGTSVNYYANITNGGSTPTYQWFLNGTPTVTTPTYNYTPSGGDVIGVRITSSFTCASPTTAYDTMVMVVDASETPDINITAYPGSTSCTGYAVTFSAHSRYRGDNPHYIWKKNGINVATGLTFTYIPVTGDSVQCLFYSNAICRTIDSVFSNVIHMTVGAATTSSVSISAFPDTTILAGTSDTISAAALNTGAGTTYQWYLNGVAVAGETNAIYVSSTFADHDSIYCVAHGDNPCSSPAIVTSNGLVIHVITVSGVYNVSPSVGAISLVPNPNTGSFTVEGSVTGDAKAATVQVTNLLGSVIFAEDAPIVNGRIRKQVIMNSEVANGLYMLQVITGSGRQVTRFNLNR